MSANKHTVPPQARPKGSIHQFWHRVSEGQALDQLWSQFAKDARASYRFYSAGLEDLRDEPSRFQRFWKGVKALFWAIFEKLTPARRVLLLLALVILFFPAVGPNNNNNNHGVVIIGPDLRLWGGLLMFVVLLLELADRVVMKRDLEIAKDIQAWLLPGAPLQIPGYQIAYATRPANTVAGDYYDVILRPGRTLA